MTREEPEEEEGKGDDVKLSSEVPLVKGAVHVYPQPLSTIDEVTSAAISGPSSLTTDQPELSQDQRDDGSETKSEKLTPDVEEIDFEAPSRGELTPEVEEIDFEDISSDHPFQGNLSSKRDDVHLSEFGNRSIYQSDFDDVEEEEVEEDSSHISEGATTAAAGVMDSSISSDCNVKEAVVDENEGEGIEESADVDVEVDEAEPSSLRSPARSPDVPQPQPPPSPFQRQFEHFVVSQSFSLEGGEHRGDQEEGEEVNTEDEEVGEGGRLLSDEEDVPGEAGKEAISQALDLNISSGRLTPEVEEINFELSSHRLSEQESEQKEMLKKNKATNCAPPPLVPLIRKFVHPWSEPQHLSWLHPGQGHLEVSFCYPQNFS